MALKDSSFIDMMEISPTSTILLSRKLMSTSDENSRTAGTPARPLRMRSCVLHPCWMTRKPVLPSPISESGRNGLTDTSKGTASSLPIAIRPTPSSWGSARTKYVPS
jgi:hypothetical protein